LVLFRKQTDERLVLGCFLIAMILFTADLQVTHIQDNCQEEIKPLLDNSAGSWTANDINFGQELFEIALECLKEKKERPTITTVSSLLGEVVQRSL
jgi:hypothetical protein